MTLTAEKAASAALFRLNKTIYQCGGYYQSKALVTCLEMEETDTGLFVTASNTNN